MASLSSKWIQGPQDLVTVPRAAMESINWYTRGSKTTPNPSNSNVLLYTQLVQDERLPSS
jgi:hypothetical protein